MAVTYRGVTLPGASPLAATRKFGGSFRSGHLAL
jgi:hypothetical protein